MRKKSGRIIEDEKKNGRIIGEEEGNEKKSRRWGYKMRIEMSRGVGDEEKRGRIISEEEKSGRKIEDEEINGKMIKDEVSLMFIESTTRELKRGYRFH